MTTLLRFGVLQNHTSENPATYPPIIDVYIHMSRNAPRIVLAVYRLRATKESLIEGKGERSENSQLTANQTIAQAKHSVGHPTSPVGMSIQQLLYASALPWSLERKGPGACEGQRPRRPEHATAGWGCPWDGGAGGEESGAEGL